MKKYTYEFVRQCFDKCGYDLLSTEYIDATSKLKYVCRKHKDMGIQEITFGYLRKHKSGCKYCGRENKKAKQYVKTKQKILDLCEHNNFTYVSDNLQNGIREVYFICNNHPDKGVQHMQLTHLSHRSVVGCNYCTGYAQMSHDEFQQQLAQVRPDIELLSSYNGAHKSITCKCKLCGHQWNARANKILLEKTQCPMCSRQSHRYKLKKTHEQFTKEFNERFPYLDLLSEYTFAYEPITVCCKKCGAIDTIKPTYLFNYGFKCHKCGSGLSYAEDKIANLLNIWGIDYTTQKRFEECKDQITLPFDFYLDNYNTCVEYDGEHHYYPVDFGYMTKDEAEQQLLLTQYHDEIKDEYCANNNIYLIRIPYWKHDDLEYELFDQLVKHRVLQEYQ